MKQIIALGEKGKAMSKHIDVEAWLKNIECTNEFLDTLKHKMTDAPSIDIVRCKECRHKYQEPWHNGVKVEGECEIWYSATLDDDFCSYGEREGE